MCTRFHPIAGRVPYGVILCCGLSEDEKVECARCIMSGMNREQKAQWYRAYAFELPDELKSLKERLLSLSQEG
jgi:hypothetical protein